MSHKEVVLYWIILREGKKIIKLIKGLLEHFTEKVTEKPTNHSGTPRVIPRHEHAISRNAISPNALKVLYRLNNAGFSAYLVGGCVRDILLNRRPKDFDVATNALPEEIRKLFKNCCLIGKRFRLAHILFGKEVIEVATFRSPHKEGQEQHGHTHKGMIIRDNVYGSIEEDAWRRDFTVNALYYNIADFSVLDYTNGMEDLKNHTLRMIGNPEHRFHEDPVRLLRAARFAGKLDLKFSKETEAPLLELSYLLQHVSGARLYQEVLKFFQEGATLPTFRLMQKYQFFHSLFPATALALKEEQALKLLEDALANTDQRAQEGKTVSPTFLFAVFLWHPIAQQMKQNESETLPPYPALEKAIRSVLREQTKILTIPRRLQMAIHDICLLQHRLTCRHGQTPHRLLNHPRFRAAYDLLLLRAGSGESIQELGTWWMQFYAGTHTQRETMIKEIHQSRAPSQKRSFRGRKKKSKTHPIT